ncbi:MAG TPA: methyltransferase domain-containing protein [Usitatibacter sp.]|nr:methyltransferase domain-containing protein [Usitatibacter sp.]
MGYGSTAHFDLIESLLAQRRRSLGPRERLRICELGDQTIQVSKEAAESLHAFAARNRIPESEAEFTQLRQRLDERVGGPMHVRDVFAAAGYDYVSIDVNEEGGARFVDLNYWPNEAQALGRFDVVTNFGTTEHVANQASAFATVHHLLRPGGVAIHHVPMVHYLNHALVNLTPRFVLGLATLNDYTVLATYVQSHCVDQAIAFHYGPDILFMQGMREMMMDSTLATMAFFVIRKNSELPYIPPVDVGNDLERFRPLLVRGMDHYNPGVGEAEKDAALRAAMARAASRSSFEPIAASIDRRDYGHRLARTGAELAASPAPATPPVAQGIAADARRKAAWLVERTKARLSPTIVGRMKRRIFG